MKRFYESKLSMAQCEARFQSANFPPTKRKEYSIALTNDKKGRRCFNIRFSEGFVSNFNFLNYLTFNQTHICLRSHSAGFSIFFTIVKLLTGAVFAVLVAQSFLRDGFGANLLGLLLLAVLFVSLFRWEATESKKIVAVVEPFIRKHLEGTPVTKSH